METLLYWDLIKDCPQIHWRPLSEFEEERHTDIIVLHRNSEYISAIHDARCLDKGNVGANNGHITNTDEYDYIICDRSMVDIIRFVYKINKQTALPKLKFTPDLWEIDSNNQEFTGDIKMKSRFPFNIPIGMGLHNDMHTMQLLKNQKLEWFNSRSELPLIIDHSSLFNGRIEHQLSFERRNDFDRIQALMYSNFAKVVYGPTAEKQIFHDLSKRDVYYKGWKVKDDLPHDIHLREWLETNNSKPDIFCHSLLDDLINMKEKTKEIKKGDWIHSVSSHIYRIREIRENGTWISENNVGGLTHIEKHYQFYWRLATEEEIEAHLIKLAKEKGFVKGVIGKDAEYEYHSTVKDSYYYVADEDTLYGAKRLQGGLRIYCKGKWATIVEGEPFVNPMKEKGWYYLENTGYFQVTNVSDTVVEYDNGISSKSKYKSLLCGVFTIEYLQKALVKEKFVFHEMTHIMIEAHMENIAKIRGYQNADKVFGLNTKCWNNVDKSAVNAINFYHILGKLKGDIKSDAGVSTIYFDGEWAKMEKKFEEPEKTNMESLDEVTEEQEEFNKNISLSTDARKCMEFLLLNGWTEVDDRRYTDDPVRFSNGELYGVDIAADSSEITFIADEGDFLEIPCNLFALIGALLVYRQIPVTFKMPA